MIDPFTLFYRKLWEVLESDAEFSRLVPPGNRIRFDLADVADKIESLHADSPEIRILMSGVNTDYWHSSKGNKISPTYVVQVAVGDLSVSQQFFPTLWAVCCAMDKLHGCDLPFVKVIRVFNISVDLPPTGWVSMVAVQPEMWFTRGAMSGDLLC